MFYGLTTQLLKDILPIHTQLNAASIRNHTLTVARTLDEKLGNEQYFLWKGALTNGISYPSRRGKLPWVLMAVIYANGRRKRRILK